MDVTDAGCPRTGVKGGKWYSLIDKVQSEATLQAAFTTVVANKGAAGVDHVSVERFAKDKDANLKRLSEELRQGSYRPQQIRRPYIPNREVVQRCARGVYPRYATAWYRRHCVCTGTDL